MWPASAGSWPAAPGSPPASSPTTEQADARRSPDPTESLAARFAAKEAVMKALGTGLGAFALTDVEVRRRAGGSAPRRPVARASTVPRPRWPTGAGRGRFHLSLTHTDRAWPSPSWWPSAPAVLPVLTRDEMRAADAAALAERVARTSWWRRAGTAVGHAALRILGGGYGRRVIVVAGKGNNGADGRVAAAVPRPPRGAGDRARRGRRPGRAAAVRPGDRRRLRHRLPRRLRRARGGGGGSPVLVHRHPLGCGRRHRRGAGRRRSRPAAR